MAVPSASTPAAATPAATPAAPERTHGCVRCGAECPIDVALCEACNPLGLKQPAATQAHGTAFLAVGIGVLLLALLGRLALSGIGPFDASVTGVAPTAGGLDVTVAVTNRGHATGATTCRIFDPQDPGIGPSDAYVSTQRIDGGATATFTIPVTTLGTTARQLSVACQGP